MVALHTRNIDFGQDLEHGAVGGDDANHTARVKRFASMFQHAATAPPRQW